MMLDKVIGLTICRGESAAASSIVEGTQRRVLELFDWLTVKTLEVDPHTRVTLWGHGDLDAHLHAEPDGTRWIASNLNRAPDWAAVIAAYGRSAVTASAVAGLEGIFVLVRIARDRIELWNDWTGASKVFTWTRGNNHGLSTLEPIAVAGARAGQTDIAPSSLYSLMRFGVYLGTSTLYRTIRLLGPDSHGTLDARGLVTSRIGAIVPSEERWAWGWDDVIEAWYALFEETFREALSVAPESTLMLSGGIDSRLIAALGSAAGHRFHAVSYGNRVWQDGIVAGKVAAALGLPLSYQAIGDDYLARFTKLWCDWFGAGISVHGMYQMPALCALRADGLNRPITTGFTGDPLEGMQIALLCRKIPEERGTLLERLARKFVALNDSAIAKLLPDLDIESAREELEAELQAQYRSFEGAEFQRLWLLFQWNRVFQFSSYQPTMYEYYFGVITPFVHSRLANFTLSLPRYALEGRRTVLEMIKRRFPTIATVPGTYDHPSPNFDFIPARHGIPLLLTKSYLTKAAIGYAMPERLRRGPLREFAPAPNAFARDAVRKHGLAALYPLDRITPAQQSIFAPAALAHEVENVLQSNELHASARLWPIQTLLHRSLEG